MNPAKRSRNALTRRQQEVLDLIARFEEACEAVTSTRLAAELGLARQNLREHLMALRDKGLVHYEAQERQTAFVRLTEQGRAMYGVHGFPLVGEVAAGHPVYAESNIETFITRLEDLLDMRPGDFLLRVRGDSMKGAGIYDGDIIAVRPIQHEPRNGEIALVLVPGENTATLKRWQRDEERVRLISDNPKYAPMEYHARDVTVQGLLIGTVGNAKSRNVPLP